MILAVEILSPSTRRKDLFLKRSKYQDAGVQQLLDRRPGGAVDHRAGTRRRPYVTVGEATGDEAAHPREAFPCHDCPGGTDQTAATSLIRAWSSARRRSASAGPCPADPKSMVAVARCPTPSTATTVPRPYLSCETRFPTASSSAGPEPSGRRPARDGELVTEPPGGDRRGPTAVAVDELEPNCRPPPGRRKPFRRK